MPAILAGRILRQQRNLLIFDTALLVSRVAVLIIGGFYLSAIQTIIAFSVIGAVFNTFLIGFMWNRLNGWKFSDDTMGPGSSTLNELP